MLSSKVLRIVLAIQNLVVVNCEFEADGLVVDVRPKMRFPRCAACGRTARQVYDRRTRRWRHLDVGGMKVFLRHEIRRVNCKHCQAVKTERVPWAAHESNFTIAFEERVAYLAQQASKVTVKNLMRIAWSTVGDIISRVVPRYFEGRQDRLEGLTDIGVDELSYRKHHEYITVVVDHERGTVVWARPGKNAETLSSFFEQLGPERAALIGTVTIDMSKAYISAVEVKAPQAQIVFDRFHVQKLVQEALDNTRRDECAAATPEDRKELKGTRFALLKNPWKLNATEVQTLATLEADNHVLYKAYLLKESFASILNRRQINIARQKLISWLKDAADSGLRHFMKAAATIEKHQDRILAYIRSRANNGRTEGLNGKIRTITRRSFGFQSPWSLIRMVELCCGGVDVTPAFSTPETTH